MNKKRDVRSNKIEDIKLETLVDNPVVYDTLVRKRTN